VGVGASREALAIRADARTDPRQVALLVETAAAKLEEDGPSVLVASSRRLRDHGLFVVELGAPVPGHVLAALARQASLEVVGLRVYPVLTRATGRAFHDERLVVTAQPGRLPAVLETVLAKTGGRVVRFSSVPHTALVEVGAPLGFDAVAASAALAGTPGLVSAEPDLYRELSLSASVDDPLHTNQWHLHRPGPNTPVPGSAQIFAHEAWETTKGSPDVVVAVFDSGIDITHEDLAPNIVSMFDPSTGDGDASAECSSSPDGRDVAASCPAQQPYRESHGTAVSGLVAARGDNGVGLSGVCPLCSLMAVRLLGDQVGSGLSTAEAFIRAVNDGAWVINNSWGPGRSRYFPMSQAERDAFDHARTAGRGGKGTVIVFAAGNSSANVASDPYASHPFAVAVAASSNLDDWASYSNWGVEIDVAAPSLGGTIQEDNHGLWTTDVTGDDGYASTAYASDFSGTSASSPVVAGLAGLVLSANPALTAEQVRLVLTRSADKIRADKINWLALTGQDINAIFAYDDNGHSIGFGYGRVNAQRAMVVARDPGLAGAACPVEGCPTCTPDGRCLLDCQGQADCPDGTVCEEGSCRLPHVVPGSLGAPCTAACVHCTTTLDTEIQVAAICTTECRADADCSTGFDCRVIDGEGLGICAVGSRAAGNHDNGTNCRSDLFQVSLVVMNELGQSFCTDVCFADEPGACPRGFRCGNARCLCSVANQSPCRGYTCLPTTGSGNWDTPLCLPDDSYGITCASTVDCPLGDYCNAQGTCRPDDRAGCSICAPCSTERDCAPGETCFRTSYQNPGTCTRGCIADTDCPGDAVCRETTRRNTKLYLCLSPSDDEDTRCVPGWSCHVPCRDDVPCDDGDTCDNGTCVPTPDAGPVPPDAGPALPDAGAADAGVSEDPDDGGARTSGCPGCSAADQGPTALLAFLLPVLARRRRDRGAPA
jgi:subtilisin family serine protease